MANIVIQMVVVVKVKVIITTAIVVVKKVVNRATAMVRWVRMVGRMIANVLNSCRRSGNLACAPASLTTHSVWAVDSWSIHWHSSGHSAP